MDGRHGECNFVLICTSIEWISVRDLPSHWQPIRTVRTSSRTKEYLVKTDLKQFSPSRWQSHRNALVTRPVSLVIQLEIATSPSAFRPENDQNKFETLSTRFYSFDFIHLIISSRLIKRYYLRNYRFSVCFQCFQCRTNVDSTLSTQHC